MNDTPLPRRTRRVLGPAGVALLSGLALAFAGPARGSEPGAGPATVAAAAVQVAGHWQVEPGADAIVAASVEQTIAPMNALFRMVARRKLLKRFPAPQTVAIERHGRYLEILFPGDRAAPLPISGEEVKVDDRSFQLRIEDGHLCRFGTSPEGTRKIGFLLQAGPRRLVVETIVTSPRLPRPLHYTLAYAPAPSGQSN